MLLILSAGDAINWLKTGWESSLSEPACLVVYRPARTTSEVSFTIDTHDDRLKLLRYWDTYPPDGDVWIQLLII